MLDEHRGGLIVDCCRNLAHIHFFVGNVLHDELWSTKMCWRKFRLFCWLFGSVLCLKHVGFNKLALVKSIFIVLIVSAHEYRFLFNTVIWTLMMVQLGYQKCNLC